MQAITFVAPIPPEREEEWRRFAQEVVEERFREYGSLRRRLGIRNESVWLVHNGRNRSAVVYLEADDPERIAPALAASGEPFDVWFKKRLIEHHGFTRAAGRGELIFAYRHASEDHEPSRYSKKGID